MPTDARGMNPVSPRLIIARYISQVIWVAVLVACFVIPQYVWGGWWWIGAAGPEQDAGPGTDFHAVRTGHISITPIHVDLTRYQALEQVASWVDGLATSLKTVA